MNASCRPFRRALLPPAIALILLAIVPNAHAGGRKEDALSKADNLIAERRYNEAIATLTAFIKREPNRFDDAQKRLQRIVRLRDEYNSLAAELLNVLVNDPTNDERKLAMIRRLEELEAAPNRAAREFILRTKETAQFTFYRAQFERIMAEGRALIDRGDYAAALRRYSDGFVLYRDEFYQAGYGDLVVSRVDAGLRSIAADLDRFAALQTRVAQATSSLSDTASRAEGPSGYLALNAALDASEATLLELAALRNRVAEVGRGFENQFLLLQGADKNLGDSSFLPFAFRFILGRKTEIRPEGMVGSLDTLWTDQVNRAQLAVAQAADRSYAEAVAAAGAGSHQAARDAFLVTAEYADLAGRAVALWSAVAGAEISPALTAFGKSIVAGKPPEFLKYRALGEASRFLAASQETAGLLAAVSAAEAPPGESAAESLARGEAMRRSYGELLGLAEEGLARVAAAEAGIAGYRSAGLVPADAAAYLDFARSDYETLARSAARGDLDAALMRYRIRNGELRSRIDSGASEFSRGRTLLEGVEVQPQAGTPYLGKYPAESLPIFTALDQAMVGLQREAQALISSYGAEPGRVSSDESLRGLAAEAAELEASVRNLLSQVRASSAEARDRVAQATSIRLEAERRYEEARSALARFNFDTARERAQRAGERYDASLAIQDSQALRAERDRRLLALSAEISKTENDIVVRDVRRLITEAKSAYFAAAFERAEDALVQAQGRWRTTNVEDEPEVAYWLTLVRGALAVKTGRTIPVTAPLYAEMSQLLSGARKAFEEGRELLNARRKADALTRFEEAKAKIQEVRIIFPLNQEAGILSLRIDQLIDPDAFGADFRRRFNEAQANLATSPQEAFSDLQDLAEINPRFPGIQAAIVRAEIQLGLRLPPPDPRSLARSNELVLAARRIVDSNIRSQFPVALEQLNEALKLNPNNEQAVTLKDRIQTDVGGQAAVVLSSAAEREYQRAVQELQRGNTIVALAIVEQLLQDPRNRNSSRILELQRRIQARL